VNGGHAAKLVKEALGQGHVKSSNKMPSVVQHVLHWPKHNLATLKCAPSIVKCLLGQIGARAVLLVAVALGQGLEKSLNQTLSVVRRVHPLWRDNLATCRRVPSIAKYQVGVIGVHVVQHVAVASEQGLEKSLNQTLSVVRRVHPLWRDNLATCRRVPSIVKYPDGVTGDLVPSRVEAVFGPGLEQSKRKMLLEVLRALHSWTVNLATRKYVSIAKLLHGVHGARVAKHAGAAPKRDLEPLANQVE
jgi:hypothetical protein